MNYKKSLCLLTILVALFAFSESTFAQTVSSVELEVSDGVNTRDTRIVFGNGSGFTTGLNPGFDAGMFGDAPDNPGEDQLTTLGIYTILVVDDATPQGIGFAIQSLPYDQIDDLSVQIGVSTPVDDSLTISANLTDYPAGHRLILEDRSLGIFTELQGAGDQYTFSLTEVEPELGRFFLHTTTDTTAPTDTGSVSSPVSSTNDVNGSIIGSCGADAENGSVRVTTTPANGFTNGYNITTLLDSNGDFTITNPNWIEGQYDINLSCTDKVGNGPVTFGPFEVRVDTTAPVITLLGESSLELYLNETYTEEGASCSDDVDALCSVVISGSVDTSVIETYTIFYDATDSASNSAIRLSREVEVKEKPRRSGGSRRTSSAQIKELFEKARQEETEQSQETDSDLSQDSIEVEQDNPFQGELCSEENRLTNNLRIGDRDGNFSTYNQGTVEDVAKLQGHITNRLLSDRYGNQPSGPTDGIFGQLTKLGVERLQKTFNELMPNNPPLIIDGIVGPKTREALNNSC
jgi:peptidoglycan hydrolase-like protein with peptidoglycan-binding domain